MAEGAANGDVKRAVALAREALEQDAAEARRRGWGIPTPDSGAVAALAAGLLVAEAINGARGARPRASTRRVSRTRASRTAA